MHKAWNSICFILLTETERKEKTAKEIQRENRTINLNGQLAVLPREIIIIIIIIAAVYYYLYKCVHKLFYTAHHHRCIVYECHIPYIRLFYSVFIIYIVIPLINLFI